MKRPLLAGLLLVLCAGCTAERAGSAFVKDSAGKIAPLASADVFVVPAAELPGILAATRAAQATARKAYFAHQVQDEQRLRRLMESDPNAAIQEKTDRERAILTEFHRTGRPTGNGDPAEAALRRATASTVCLRGALRRAPATVTGADGSFRVRMKDRDVVLAVTSGPWPYDAVAIVALFHPYGWDELVHVELSDSHYDDRSSVLLPVDLGPPRPCPPPRTASPAKPARG